MAKAMHMPSIPNFIIDEDQHTLDQRWTKWRKKLDYFILASGITQDVQKRATLLHMAGERVQQVFETLGDTGTSFQHACDVLDAYFKPKKNVTFERYKFKQLTQERGETTAMYITRMRQAVGSCEYSNVEEEIRDHFIASGFSLKLKRRLLTEQNLTLEKLLELARAMENSQTQANIMSKGSESDGNVNVLNNRRQNHEEQRRRERFQSRPSSFQSRQNKPLYRQQKSNNPCRNCGNEWSKSHIETCPTQGQTCRKCSKQNRFARVCRSGKANERNSTRPPFNNAKRIPVNQIKETCMVI